MWVGRVNPLSPTNSIMLKVKDYNNLEKLHSAKFPNYTLQAFLPVTFALEGLNCNVEGESQLWRFIDTMQENRFKQNLNDLEILTDEEFNMLKHITHKVLEFSESLNCKLSAKNAITRSLIAYRAIRNVLPKNSTIMEVGPGSGYLSAILALSGYKVLSLEISQGFYIYQNHFYNFLLKDKFHDLAINEIPVIDFERSDLIHVPWWHWADLSISYPSIDMVNCNHAINEMHTNSAKFLIRRTGDLMTNKNSLYLFESGGFGKYRDNLGLFKKHFLELYYGTCNGEQIGEKITHEIHIYGRNKRNLTFKVPQYGHSISSIFDYYKKIKQLDVRTEDEKFSDYIQSKL